MNFSKLGLAVIETEARAVMALAERIDKRFTQACEIILSCQGRIVVTGMGKSGHIANKIASTLSSTGTPAFFMHPGEASHGDLGMVVLLPLLKRMGVRLIALTGKAESILAISADVNLDVSIEQEACPLGLAPTTSTTVSLVMGDALAIALLQARGFSAEDFALSHPGGTLGKRLLLRVDELWHCGDNLPIVDENVSIREALMEVSEKKLGMTTVIDNQGILSGVYTDGDIRRTLHDQHDINTTPLHQVMTRNCLTIKPGILAAEALSLMQENRITSLIAIDLYQRPTAVIHLHDLLRAGVY